MHDSLQHFILIWFGWVRDGGYIGIIALMAMESSVLPVPSEIVIPPAAYWALQAGGHTSIAGVILAGTFGSWLGSALSYWISRWAGRSIVTGYGRYIALSETKLLMAERWLHRYEAGGIFFARLLPVIRHLISIPAGLVRMNFGLFSAMTIIGSALWCGALAWFGQQVIGSDPALLNNPGQLLHTLSSKSHLIAAVVLALGLLYFVVLKLTAPKGR